MYFKGWGEGLKGCGMSFACGSPEFTSQHCTVPKMACPKIKTNSSTSELFTYLHVPKFDEFIKYYISFLLVSGGTVLY